MDDRLRDDSEQGADTVSHSGAASPQDDAFEALLREAARGTTPTAPGTVGQLATGTQLCGGRLSVVKKVGEGGMGVVYEAFDAQRKQRVALKTLNRLDAGSVYRLKNEFRALAEVRHDHLVRLHELFNDQALWCFTMELVDGERFDSWVRPRGEGCDEAKLRVVLPQLVQAVGAIHAAGKLHRDLKPSNVLVTPEGRVVVLDFGLAVDPELGGVGQTVADQSVSGTPDYMAPEQASGGAATSASDFYALGVMLFEALTGRLPFEGRTGQVLAAKQTQEAPSVLAWNPKAPAELVGLCAGLLARDPIARPGLAGLVAALPAAATSHLREAPHLTATQPREGLPDLLGRDRELAALHEAFAATLEGRSVVLFVSGESGMGKSALCEAFLHALRSQGRATVLAGRCYERENVPFKGLDSLVDDLSRHLRRVPREEAIAVLPREVHALARLFPVLDRVEVIADAPKKEVPDPQELRRRAYAAFGELLARMRDRAPLCVHLDDVQWLDTDAVLFMRALLVHPEPTPSLLILSHRSEDAENSAAIRRVREAIESNRGLELRALNVGPLSTEESCGLARNVLPASVPAREQAVAAVAREAGGSPFFVQALARYVERFGSDEGVLRALSLKVALSDRLQRLSASARRLLEASAFTGKPLPQELLLQAAEATHADLDLLRAAHLLRLSSLEGDPRLECYHDKVRESVSAGLTDLRRVACAASLAAALEPYPDLDPELLARCFEIAGQPAKAGQYSVRAAEQSARGAAFQHAADLYERALGLGTWDDPQAHALRIAQAEALAQAGRGREAADVFVRAAQNAGADESVDLRRRAAEQFFTTGHTVQGMALFREIFADEGMSLPRSTAAALRRLLVSELRLRVRGLRHELRDASAIEGATLRKLQTLRAALDGMSSNVPLVAAALADNYLLTALGAGEAQHLSNALSFKAYFVSFAFPGAEERINHLLDLALGLARDSGSDALLGRTEMIIGASLSIEGGGGRAANTRPGRRRSCAARCTESTGRSTRLCSTIRCQGSMPEPFGISPGSRPA